jgi:WD40 repeat protein
MQPSISNPPRFEGKPRVRAVAVGRLGDRDVIVSGGDETVRVWDEDGRPVGAPLIGHTGSVYAVAVGPLGDRDVIVSGGDETVRVWDEDGRPVGAPLTSHAGWVDAVAVGRLGDRDVIVAAGGNETVRVWDEDGRPVGEPFALMAPARGVAIGSANLIVATGTALAQITV